MVHSLLNDWAGLCTGMAYQEKKSSKPNTKTFNGLTFTIQGEHYDDTLQLPMLGYKENSTKKMSQLMMHYFNDDSVAQAKKEYKKIVKKSGIGSVGISCRGQRTGDKKQDFCIQGCTITKLFTKKTRVDIFYRNTELIKKFGADLVFFRDKLLPHFNQLPIESINFYFANANLNAMFYPLLIPYQTSWVAELQVIQNHDLKFYQNILRWSLRYLNGEGDSYRFIKRIQDSLPRLFTEELYQDFSTTIRRLSNEQNL